MSLLPYDELLSSFDFNIKLLLYIKAFNALQDDVRGLTEERDDAVYRRGLLEARRRLLGMGGAGGG